MKMFTIHAGDFKVGKVHAYRPKLPLQSEALQLRKKGKFFPETILLTEIATVEMASEEAVKRVGGTIGWGLAGAAVFGPAGLLAGLIAGGRSKDVTFVCQLKDGRRFLATAPSSVYQRLAASVF